MLTDRKCERCRRLYIPCWRKQRFCSYACALKSRPKKSIEERFWSKVKKTSGCWIWIGRKTRRGYGSFVPSGRRLQVGVRRTGAHRQAWELERGPIPKGKDVLHKCDNPPCVKPDHLFIGTQLDNMRDMDRKDRRRWKAAPGEANGNSKLTAIDVHAIRRLILRGGLTRAAIADRFGVSAPMISYIASGKNWGSV